MKVCHISSAHAPNDTRIFHKQCASLARAGYDTTFVVKAKDPQSVGETTEKGVRVIQVVGPLLVLYCTRRYRY